MTGTAKAALLFAVLSIAAFAAAGGDKPDDHRLQMLEPLPVTELCPRLRDGHWLRAIVVQENHRHFRFHGCYYGLQSELERQWYGY